MSEKENNAMQNCPNEETVPATRYFARKIAVCTETAGTRVPEFDCIEEVKTNEATGTMQEFYKNGDGAIIVNDVIEVSDDFEPPILTSADSLSDEDIARYMADEPDGGKGQKLLFIDVEWAEARYKYKHEKREYIINGVAMELTEEQFDDLCKKDFAQWIEDYQESHHPSVAFEKIETPTIEDVYDVAPSFADILHCKLSGMPDAKRNNFWKKADISYDTFRRALRNCPSKATAISIGITLGFNLEELKEFIAKAGYVLSDCIKEDRAIKFCLYKGATSVDDVNELLIDTFGMVPLSEMANDRKNPQKQRKK